MSPTWVDDIPWHSHIITLFRIKGSLGHTRSLGLGSGFWRFFWPRCAKTNKYWTATWCDTFSAPNGGRSPHFQLLSATFSYTKMIQKQDLPLIGEQVSRKLRMRLPLSWDGKIQWQGERLCSYAAIIMSTRIPWSKSLRTSDTQIGIDRQGSTDHSLSPLLFTTDIELQKPPCLRALSAARLFGLCQAQVVTSHFFFRKSIGCFRSNQREHKQQFQPKMCRIREMTAQAHMMPAHVTTNLDSGPMFPSNNTIWSP